jgi:hypothetical protein
MGRLTFVPYNNEGEIVKRGLISITDRFANRAAIIDKVAYCGRRDGIGKIVHVEVYNVDKTLHSAWDIRTGAVVQTDGLGCETFESAYVPADTGNQKGAEMATVDEVAGAEAAVAKKPGRPKKTDTTAKESKEAKAPKAKAPVRTGPTKKGTVLEMMQQTDTSGMVIGTTVEEIQGKLAISTAAARALIGDCQRMKNVAVTRTRVDDTNRYTAIVSEVVQSEANENDAGPAAE